MSIGKRIKELRKKLGLSVDEIAEKLGKNRATIYRYESDEIENLPITIIEPLAEILGTTPSYLMGWDDELAQIEHDLEVLDAKVYFHHLLRELISHFGYEVEEGFASDEDGNTTVLLESKTEAFEVKESDYNTLLNSCFSFIDYEFNKMIKEENRVESNFFIKNYRDNDGKEPFHKKWNRKIEEEIERQLHSKTNKDQSHLLPNAAHEIEGASNEDKTHDDALMDDDDF